MQIQELFEDYLDMENNNLLCYSTNCLMDTPKKGYEREYEQVLERIELLTGLADREVKIGKYGVWEDNMVNLKILTAAEATEILRGMGMRISPEILREGIEQNRFDFGDVVRSKNDSPRCYVYEKKLMQWAKDKGYEELEVKNG